MTDKYSADKNDRRKKCAHHRHGHANALGRAHGDYKWKGDNSSYRNANDRTGAIPSLPLLRLPTSENQVESEGNLINFRLAIETYVRREYYGDIANIFTLVEYPEYSVVHYDPEELKKKRDPFGWKKNEKKKLMIIHLERQEKLESDKPKVCALIKGQLSQESLDKVKQMPNWREFDAAGDPLELTRRIEATHLTRIGIDNGKTKLEAREAFNKCRQQFNESIVQFKQLYDDRIAALRALAEHVLDEPALAIYFIHKIDMRRYHELRKDYENNLFDCVENLDAAYELESNYVVERRNDRELYRVFIADARGGRSERGRGRGRMRNGRGGRGGASEPTSGGGKRRWGPSADRPCAICQSPSHSASDCPDRDDQDKSEAAGKDKHTKSEKGTKGKSKVRYVNAIAIVPDNLLSAGDMCDTVSNDGDKMDQ